MENEQVRPAGQAGYPTRLHSFVRHGLQSGAVSPCVNPGKQGLTHTHRHIRVCKWFCKNVAHPALDIRIVAHGARTILGAAATSRVDISGIYQKFEVLRQWWTVHVAQNIFRSKQQVPPYTVPFLITFPLSAESSDLFFSPATPSAPRLSRTGRKSGKIGNMWLVVHLLYIIYIICQKKHLGPVFNSVLSSSNKFAPAVRG